MPDDHDGPTDVGHEDTLVPLESESNEDSEWSPFDDLTDEFAPRPIPKVMAEDGMPSPKIPPAKSDIPVLSKETLVCMGDYSSFVLRDAFGETIAMFDPANVERAPNGAWRVSVDHAVEKAKLYIERDRKRSAEQMSDPFLRMMRHDHDGETADAIQGASDRVMLAMILGEIAKQGGRVAFGNYDWVEVEPQRPPCVHYVRQLGQADFNPEIQRLHRLCSARRTTEGAFMGISDRGVWACSMREPVDMTSERLMDEFDEKKIAEGANRKYLPLFGAGIFSTRKESDG